MQSPEEEKKNQRSADPQEVELSEAWRALLGLRPDGTRPNAGEAEPTGQVQPLPGDPWGHLINAQGMQTVDLQKIQLHNLHPATNDEDVEHALNLMREATGPLQTLREQNKEQES